MSNGAIISFRNDRLGARLISLVNALRVGRKFDLPVKVHWVVTPGVGSEFNDPTDLFSEDFVEQYFIGKPEFRARRDACERLERFTADPARLVSHVQGGGDAMSAMAFGILCFDDEDPASVARECGEVFRSLPMAPELAPLVQSIRDELANAVAYHIRRGDLVSDIRASNRAWPHKFVPDAYYQAHMDDMLKAGRRVVMFSDSADTLASYSKAFPQLTTFEQIAPVEGLSRGAQDFLELYAMSCCPTIIAPESSAFSTTASELGGVLKVDVKQDLSPTRRTQIGDVLLKTAVNKPHKLGAVGEFAQVIPHIAEHLIEAGRWAECVALYEKVTLTDRVPASFLYPQALNCFLEAGRPDLAMQLADALPECPVYHDRDRVRCCLPVAAAAAVNDQPDRAFESIRNVMAYQHNAGGMRKVIVFLASVGALPPDRFFPISLDSMCFERQKFASSGLKGPEHIIAAKLAPDHALGLRGYLEPISLDWYPWLLNGPNLKSVVDGNRGSDFAARLRVAAKAQGAHPEVKSLVALIDVILGSKDISGLEDAVHELPDSVVLWQRLANAQYMTRDWSGAIGSAREMMRRKTSPAHDAFAAKVFLRDPDCRQEARELASAATASGWNFAPFFAILSEAAAMLGDKEGAHEAASTAAALMPTTQHRYEQARKAMAVGAQDEATDLLLGLRDQQKLPRSAYSILIPALREANNRGAARQVLAEAKVLFADKPDFLSRLEETI